MKGRSAPDKEMRVVLKHAHALGWEVARVTKHIQLRHPDFPEGRPVTVPCTPADPTLTRKQMIKRLDRYPYKKH